MTGHIRLRGIAAILAAAVAVGGLSACGSSSDGGSTASGGASTSSSASTGGGDDGGGDYTVGVSWSALSTPYFTGLKSGLDAAAKSVPGLKLIEVQANNDANQQLNQLSQLETQKVDLMVVNPADASTIVGGIKQVAAGGTPVVTIDRMIPEAAGDVAAHVGASAEEAGYLEAQAVCRARGNTAKYLGIYGLPGNQTTRDRVAGIKRGARDRGCDLQLVEEKYEQGETTEAAATTTANWLQKYGPGQVDAIITYADSQAAGALQELRSQNRTDVVVTGAANFGPFHDAICDGNRQALATVDFDVVSQGRTLLETIQKLRDRQQVPRWVQTRQVLVTPENRATCSAR